MSDKSNPRDYEVGYGKPPKEHQFRKGHSGNWKGRPKGSKNLKTEIQEELQQLVSVIEGGKTRRISKKRAMIKRQTANAINGDIRSFAKLMDLYLRLVDADEGAADTTEILTDEEKDVFKRVEARLRRKIESDPRQTRTGKSASDLDDPYGMLD